jgi:hypothetical protein
LNGLQNLNKIFKSKHFKKIVKEKPKNKTEKRKSGKRKEGKQTKKDTVRSAQLGRPTSARGVRRTVRADLVGIQELPLQ